VGTIGHEKEWHKGPTGGSPELDWISTQPLATPRSNLRGPARAGLPRPVAEIRSGLYRPGP